MARCELRQDILAEFLIGLALRLQGFASVLHLMLAPSRGFIRRDVGRRARFGDRDRRGLKEGFDAHRVESSRVHEGYDRCIRSFITRG